MEHVTKWFRHVPHVQMPSKWLVSSYCVYQDLSPVQAVLTACYATGSHNVTDQHRTNAKRTLVESPDDIFEDEAGMDGLGFVLSLERETQLFEALTALSEIERDVVIAHSLKGIPFNQLAIDFNLPLNTLLSHKARGMKKLKSTLEQLNGDL